MCVGATRWVAFGRQDFMGSIAVEYPAFTAAGDPAGHPYGWAQPKMFGLPVRDLICPSLQSMPDEPLNAGMELRIMIFLGR